MARDPFQALVADRWTEWLVNRLTEQVRHSLHAAHGVAGDFVGTEHLLLALATSPGVASGALVAAGLPFDRLAAVVPAGRGGRSGTIPFSPAAKRAIELSLGEALGLGDEQIGTAHVLLALMTHDGDNRATEAVESLGVMRDAVRQAAFEALTAGDSDA